MDAQSRTRSRPATIQDVARHANVVPSTVSHALNGTAPISEVVRKRILAAVRELNYRPNAVARSLSTGRTMTVGLLVADMTDPYVPDLIGAIETTLGAAGYDLLLCNAAINLERTQAFLASLASKYVDALIVVTDGLPREVLALVGVDARAGSRAMPAPTVLVGDGSPDSPAEGLVTPDLSSGIEAACRHLWELGHRQVAVMTDALQPWAAAMREVVFIAAWERCGGRRDEVVVLACPPRLDGGRQVLAALLERQPMPTALLAVNDMAAIGVVQAAEERGLRVPQRLSVVGIGDIMTAALVQPALTTIALPRRGIGKVAAELALQLIADTPQASLRPRVYLPSVLIVRRSTCPPHAYVPPRWSTDHHRG